MSRVAAEAFAGKSHLISICMQGTKDEIIIIKIIFLKKVFLKSFISVSVKDQVNLRCFQEKPTGKESPLT